MFIYQDRYTYDKFRRLYAAKLYKDAIIMRKEDNNGVYDYFFGDNRGPFPITLAFVDKKTNLVNFRYPYAIIDINTYTNKLTKSVILHKSLKSLEISFKPYSHSQTFYMTYQKMIIKLGMISVKNFKGNDIEDDY